MPFRASLRGLRDVHARVRHAVHVGRCKQCEGSGSSEITKMFVGPIGTFVVSAVLHVSLSPPVHTHRLRFAHLVEKPGFQAASLRKGLSNSCGPELVWYGSADTHCIRYYRLHLTIRTYTTVLCGSKTHLAPACNATRVARCCSHHNRNCSLRSSAPATAAKDCVSRAQCRCSQPTDHVIITVGEPGHEENCDR